MPRQSAGILLYRYPQQKPEVFLVHPGGPYFKGKHTGTWSIPKGEYDNDEEALTAALREFTEETGTILNGGTAMPLTPIKQKGGKIVTAWAIEGNIDEATIQSNNFRMEYPYKSGKWIDVPEVDEGGWFDFDTARQRINPAQAALIDELETYLKK